MDKKRVLIVDDNESLVHLMDLLLESHGFIPINSKPIISRSDILTCIKYYFPDIILLDHELDDDDNNGLDIAQIIPDKISTLVLSTSILVQIDKKLMDSYKAEGVYHFPGKDFFQIKKCIDGDCDCISPLVSFLP